MKYGCSLNDITHQFTEQTNLKYFCNTQLNQLTMYTHRVLTKSLLYRM